MSSTHGHLAPPIQDFSDCHVGIVTMLDDLTTLSQDQNAAAGRSAVAARTLAFFRDAVTVHHQEEESELFAAVMADAMAGDERGQVEGLVSQLVNEHRRAEKLFSDLAPALTALASGQAVTVDTATVNTLVTEYRAHARLEEVAFLPLAQAILGRNSNHMAALGLSLHIRHTSGEVRQRFGFI